MEAKRKAVDALSGQDFEPGVAQYWAQFFGVRALLQATDILVPNFTISRVVPVNYSKTC